MSKRGHAPERRRDGGGRTPAAERAPRRAVAPAAPARALGNSVLAALGPDAGGGIVVAVTRGIGAPGRPLDPATRAAAQARIGRDLGDVRGRRRSPRSGAV
jgi:hypothetical protein